MVKESSFQTKVAKWLRSKGCKVIKYNQNATTRAGIPDLMFFKAGFWGWLEVKKAKNAPKRPGQELNVKWANENSYGRFCYPENFDEIKAELGEMLRD